MSRSPLFHDINRLLRLAQAQRTETVDPGLTPGTPSRRDVLRGMGAAALATLPGQLFGQTSSTPRIAIVGAGLAGLACADRLKEKGVTARVFEAGTRLGGRCSSNRTLVPGMVCENGGEFIDTGHKAMLGYARRFGLARESVIKRAGEERFFFFGRHWDEADVVAQFRAVVDRMQGDLHAISGAASYYASNEADRRLDATDLASYFGERCAGYPLVEAVLNEAYLAEYGLETSEQSTLNFLGFMRLNRQSKFEPFGVSDERFHLVHGNDGIIAGLASELPGQISTGARLTRLGRNAAGEYMLYFNGGTIPERFDAVVLAIPFSVLRTVQLDASLNLSGPKLRAIRELGYGANAKTMIGFQGRQWATAYGASGTAYADLADVQTVWETNRILAGSQAILTDYASGQRGAALRPDRVQQQVSAFLGGLDQVFPGVAQTAMRQGGRYVAHLEHWPSHPLFRGSYTCYRPGQFTSIEGLPGEPAGLLKFAGEHADSFYSWQGYMEGACLSGLRAAGEILDDIRSGRL